MTRELIVGLIVVGLAIGMTGLAAAGVPDQSVRNADESALENNSGQATASFTIADFQGPAQAKVGETVVATATVRNTGDESGSTTVQYRIGGQVVASTTVTVAPGDTVAVTLQGTVPSLATGTYQQGVFLGTTDVGETSQINIGTPAATFAVLSLQAPSEGQIGDSIIATATIKNTGDASGTKTFQYRIGSTVIASEERTIAAGEEITLTLEGTVPNIAAGAYLQGVFEGTTNNGLTKSLSVTAPEASFEITSLEAPATAEVGQTISATVAVQNTGDAKGSTTLRYRINGKTIASKDITLEAGAKSSVKLSGTVPELADGTYNQDLTVSSTGLGLASKIKITQQPSAYFRVTNLNAPAEAQRNSDIVVSAKITNAGAKKAKVPIEYRIGSQVVKRTTVELGPDKSTTVEFDVTVPDLARGTYTQGVFIDQSARGQTTSIQVRTGPQFRISGLVAPPSARIDDQISAQVTVRNTGDTEGTRTLQYKLGDLTIAERSVQLKPEKSETITLTGTVPSVAPGTYRQAVVINGEGPSTKITLTAKPRPMISVVSFRGPQEVFVGQTLQASATVQNTGDAAGTATFEYRLNGIVLSNQQVSLNPGESRELTFQAEAPTLDTGTYTQGVYISGTNQGTASQIRLRAGKAQFSVGNVQSQAEATIGDQLTVQATITNTGTAAGETEIQYRLAGEVLDATTVNLASGESQQVSFEITVPEKSPGVYRQGVFIGTTSQGQTTSLAVAPEQTPKPRTVIKTQVVEKTVVKTVRKTDAPGLDGFGIPVALVALFATILFALRRRKL